MEGINRGLLAKRADALAFYSPYNFIRNLPADQNELFGSGRFRRFLANPDEQLFSFPLSEEQQMQFLYTALPWDSNFFGTRTFKLQTALFDPATPVLNRAAGVQAWQNEVAVAGSFYCFSEIPTEDTELLQTLTASGWRLVETRLLFYHDQLAEFSRSRTAVRAARPDEAEHIGRIAANARNPYDRFHADTWFGEERANAFLSRYASAAVRGYCDIVLVPDEPGVPVDSFLAVNDLTRDAKLLGVGLSRIVLTAVGPQNRGWHLQLVSETLQRAREQNAEYVLMTTQSTNRAVFRNCEKLGFKLGGCSHVMAYHHNAE